MGDLAGRVAVVTGASRGLGFRLAEGIAHEGATVAMLARSVKPLEEAARRIGNMVLPIQCDVSDPDSVRAAFVAIAERTGRIDILINNAAISDLHLIEHASDASIMREIAINLAGPIFCCRAVIPHMRRAGGGDIINISSESARLPFPSLTVYAATKGGLEVLSNGLRSEVAPDKIRVTTVRAGHMGESGISAHWSPEDRAAWDQIIAKSGHAAFTGGTFPPTIAAEAILSLLKLPRSANVDLIEIRSAEPPK